MSHYITDKVLYMLAGLCFILGMAELVRHGHGTFPIEQMPLFYCGFGFVIYLVLIFLAKGLRRLILRPEDYYGAEATDQEDQRFAGTEEAPDA